MDNGSLVMYMGNIVRISLLILCCISGDIFSDLILCTLLTCSSAFCMTSPSVFPLITAGQSKPASLQIILFICCDILYVNIYDLSSINYLINNFINHNFCDFVMHVLMLYLDICVTKSFYSGKCLRFEEKVGIKEDVLLDQGIKEITGDERPLEIVTALDMLNNERG